MLNLADVFFAFQLAAVGWTFCCVLLANGHILEGYGDWLDNLKTRGYGRIARPLGWCESCFTGQLAFWTWIVLYWGEWTLLKLLGTVIFVSLAILFVNVIKSVVQK